MNKIIVLIITLLIGFIAAYIFFTLNPFSSGNRIDTSRTAVIKQLQNLNRLETTSYTIEKIIEEGKKRIGTHS